MTGLSVHDGRNAQASKLLSSPSSSKTVKSVAGSALTQAPNKGKGKKK